MSTTCFAKLFKATTGHSFISYLNKFRLERASELLASSTKSIAEISVESGFCNQSYFGAMFRRARGTTPLAYRMTTDGMLH